MDSSFKLPGLTSLARSLRIGDRKPPTGYTQGGSSRKNGGAKVAGRDAGFKPKKLPVKLWNGE